MIHCRDTWNSTLQYSRFFGSDLCMRISKDMHMVQSDIGDNGNQRYYDVCRVQPSTQANFQN